MALNRRLFLEKTIYGATAFSLGKTAWAMSGPQPGQKSERTATASSQKQVSYREAIVKKYPEQVIVTIAKDKDGKANPVTMGWTMITSGRPAMLACSMHLGHYTTTCVRHSQCFTLAFPSVRMKEAVLYFGTHSGWSTDKFAEYGKCRHEAAKKINSVLLTDAVANFECKLEDEFITGDHVIFVGRVVASHINTAAKRRLYIIGPGKQLGPVRPGA